MTDHRTEDLGFARVDVDRARRTGDAEVVYGAGKTPEQVVSILQTLHQHHPDRAVLATRLTEESMAAAEAAGATVDRVARAATLGPLPTGVGTVAVVAAGTSDAPVAVPTSVGYGASLGGIAALLGMLNSCAPGVTVVNIDNGYGAGVFAARVARRAAR